MHLRVDRVLEHEGGQQIRQVLILLVLVADLDIKDVKSNNSIVDELHKFLDCFLKLLKEPLVLICENSAGLVHLVEAQVLFNCL